MTYKIEILEEKKNPLIDRLEVKFRIDHFGESTPNRLEIKEKLAAMKGGKIDLTIVKNIQTYFGTPSAIGKGYIYEKQEDIEFYEPFHIRVRNLPKERRGEIYKLKKKKESYKHLFEAELKND
ncbi:MAG: 30S ribosomal protein S24e [Promethearchaeota archaeon]